MWKGSTDLKYHCTFWSCAVGLLSVEFRRDPTFSEWSFAKTSLIATNCTAFLDSFPVVQSYFLPFRFGRSQLCEWKGVMFTWLEKKKWQPKVETSRWPFSQAKTKQNSLCFRMLRWLGCPAFLMNCCYFENFDITCYTLAAREAGNSG